MVAAHGLRGLTHRAVDREAGLPEGSCSSYLRTRHAMISALGEYVASRLTSDVRGLRDELAGCSGDHERAVALTSELFLRWREDELDGAVDGVLAALAGHGLLERCTDGVSWRRPTTSDRSYACRSTGSPNTLHASLIGAKASAEPDALVSGW